MSNKNKQRNIKLLIEYDGTNYHGWQTQNQPQRTIQETITQAIKQVTGEQVTLYGASRTDAGVHAIGQVANFFTRSKLTPDQLTRAINAHLPPDIVIKKVEEAPLHFNARFQACAKTYLYTILTDQTPSALNRLFMYFCPRKRWALSEMRKAAQYLLGKHDFRAFATKEHPQKNCLREIYSLSIDKKNHILRFKIKGNGFLHNMIRAIVGTLLLVGERKIKPIEVKKILESGDRKRAGPNVPAHGLCLVKVEYPKQGASK